MYSSVERCVQFLAAVDEAAYSKWLVVLTDTADFTCANAKGVFDKEAPARAEASGQQLVGALQATRGLNLVLVDAHEVANFNPKQPLWPTWRKVARRLTDEVGSGNTGLFIEAADEGMIDEAFEKVGGAMQGGAA